MKSIFLVRKVVLSTLLLCTFMIAYGQDVDIRFHRDSVNCDLRSACYTTQIRPNGTIPINLGGQNYRIFYNSSRAKTTSVTSLLPSQYGALSLVQDYHDIDASSNGAPISFKATLGFLNYAIDLSDVQNGGVEIPLNEWLSTTRVCFEIDQEVFEDPNKCLEAVWGREGLTDSLASAFVQISRWVTTNRTTSTKVIEYYDLDSSSGDEACFTSTCGNASSYGIFINDVLVKENSGQVSVQICLDGSATQNVSVTVKTSNGTALAGEDYVALTDSIVTIPAGQTCVPVTISILDDDFYEGDETFNVELSNPSSNATIIRQTGIVTIDDDEEVPTLSIDDIIVNENEGNAVLAVSLSGKMAIPVSFKVNMADNTAKEGDDYEPIQNRLFTIPAKTTSIMINIPIINDDIYEPDETFNVIISEISNGLFATKDVGVVTIMDDENIPVLNISDVVVMEYADIIYVPVILSGKSSQDVTFTVNTNNITALGGFDYNVIINQTFTITSGHTTTNIPVIIIDDLIEEPAKTFEIELSNISSNAEISVDKGIVTILDDDGICDASAPKLSKK